jgi:hypothetical protein
MQARQKAEWRALCWWRWWHRAFESAKVVGKLAEKEGKKIGSKAWEAERGVLMKNALRGQGCPAGNRNESGKAAAAAGIDVCPEWTPSMLFLGVVALPDWLRCVVARVVCEPGEPDLRDCLNCKLGSHGTGRGNQKPGRVSRIRCWVPRCLDGTVPLPLRVCSCWRWRWCFAKLLPAAGAAWPLWRCLDRND